MDPQRPARGSGALSGLEALDQQRRRAPAAPAPADAASDPVWQGASTATTAPPHARAPQHPDPRVEAPIVQSWGHPGARQRIRRRGPFVALVVPAALGVAALIVLRGSTSTGTGVGGFALSLMAAPLLPAFGAPLRTGSGAVTGAVVASAALWFVLGSFAARRSTRSVDAGWGRFWGEFLWLSACVWMGAVLAEVAANLVLGRILV